MNRPSLTDFVSWAQAHITGDEKGQAHNSSEAQPGQGRLSYLSAQNFYGLDIQPFAVEIAKVTMMIARKLAIDEAHATENALPLDNLDRIVKDGTILDAVENLPWSGEANVHVSIS